MAHREIDLAHSDRNRNTAGFTDEERKVLTIFSKEALQTLFAIYMAMLQVFIPGGRSVPKRAKSTIPAGGLIIGW